MLRRRRNNDFPDENNWPFLARTNEINRCLTFLEPEKVSSPSRLLQIVGESGCGKTFFTKELICRFSAQVPNSISLYVNIEESGFESTQLEKRLALLASYPSRPTRKNPQNVPEKAQMAKYLRVFPRYIRTARYTYKGVKELTTLIPLVGKIFSTLLPSEFPVSKKREMAMAGRFWDYLILMAHQMPVLVVIDNIQFLPESVAIDTDLTLAASDIGFRFITIERLEKNPPKILYQFRVFQEKRHKVKLSTLFAKETSSLARAVLGKRTSNISQIGELLFRKSHGNPKQIWLQLRSYQSQQRVNSGTRLNLRSSTNIVSEIDSELLDSYEETIANLHPLDRITLQLVTMLMGGLKIDDLTGILRKIVSPVSEEDIKRAVLDLVLFGLLIINGTHSDRIKPEHELVTVSIRRSTTEEEAIELRSKIVSALSKRLEEFQNRDEEYDRLVDRLIGLVSPGEIRAHLDLFTYLISLIDRQYAKERFHYLGWLFETPSFNEILDLLPSRCLEAFLDAFQKTSQFDKGLAAVELIRASRKLPERNLLLFASKYLVQRFEYNEAELLLRQVDSGSDRDLILFNILLNLRRDKEARQIVETIPISNDRLDEFQCVILRNCSHLYPAVEARNKLNQSLEGFSQLGSLFGHASTLNNLGVLELWCGNYNEAEKHLTSAQAAFKELESNEEYQPLTNLAVLSVLKGDSEAAINLLEQAQARVSLGLRMDSIMLQFNRLVLDLIEGNIIGASASDRADKLYELSLETRDIRFQLVLQWFASQLRSQFVEINSVFDENNCEFLDGQLSGLEIFVDRYIGTKKIKLVFILSPHWRY